MVPPNFFFCVLSISGHFVGGPARCFFVFPPPPPPKKNGVGWGRVLSKYHSSSFFIFFPLAFTYLVLDTCFFFFCCFFVFLHARFLSRVNFWGGGCCFIPFTFPRDHQQTLAPRAFQQKNSFFFFPPLQGHPCGVLLGGGLQTPLCIWFQLINFVSFFFFFSPPTFWAFFPAWVIVRGRTWGRSGGWRAF